ncbi:hypothetical protein KSS93_24705 [Pseudomonas xanthosomatis]|uniref:hypothetical protein n=1 Tax=Pseudomonas xanthosomatis TaxID=2842356 RepID=UPI001C3E0BAE|nr:hypothetical protein [Pseudomonas xanthosomatis]QXH46031.1 hypothetical protein KSS93_24705 [Pseudomonas xanthosomatis]
MSHLTNISEFKKAFNCGSDLVECYCQLIAIELKLAHIHPLKDHDIISKLQNLASSVAGQPHAADLNTRILELKSAFKKIHVEAKFGTRKLFNCAYPTIRYTRFSNDWTLKNTNQQRLSELKTVIQHTINTLAHLGENI